MNVPGIGNIPLPVAYSSLIRLRGMVVGATRTTLRNGIAAAGYQITAGKSFKCLYAIMHTFGSAGAGVRLAYSDNDVGQTSATAFTNAVYFATGGTSGDNVACIPPMVGTAGYPSEGFIVDLQGYTAVAAKYIGIAGTTNEGIFIELVGYEV
jgi:hypothetical protein